jgi:riboflavin transporter FmnP
MERSDAERVFALVTQLDGDLRGRIVSERWWLVWLVMGIQILLTSSITQLLLWNGETGPLVFFALWGLHVLLIPPIILFIHRRGGGQRTATETYIWWIWSAFIVAAACVGLLNQLSGLPLFFNAPVLALLAAFAFSMMAMVTHRFLLICTAIFALVAALMHFFPNDQFLIYGLAWCATLVTLGIYFRLATHPHAGRQL